MVPRWGRNSWIDIPLSQARSHNETRQRSAINRSLSTRSLTSTAGLNNEPQVKSASAAARPKLGQLSSLKGFKQVMRCTHSKLHSSRTPAMVIPMCHTNIGSLGAAKQLQRLERRSASICHLPTQTANKTLVTGTVQAHHFDQLGLGSKFYNLGVLGRTNSEELLFFKGDLLEFSSLLRL